MKKITDKERLDWLTKHPCTLESAGVFRSKPGWAIEWLDEIFTSPRAAIDAAILSEKKAEKSKRLG